MASRRRSWRAACFGIFVLASPALAQYGPGTSDSEPNNYPPALPDRRGPPPRLTFELLGEIPLPGPLGDGAPWLSGERLAVPVAGGVARVAAEAGAVAEITGSETPPSPDVWVTAVDGRRRYRTTAEGIVEAETWSRLRKRWAREWMIVAPNSLLAPPILVGARLCYSGLDDRVVCVRASNGHRLWAVDLGDRISRPLARWPAAAPAHAKTPKGDRAIEGEILLAVPDDGASLIALDAYDGTRVASYELPPTHHFASAALVAASGTIAVTRKGYEDPDAALVLLRLRPSPKPAPPGGVPYNDASPAPAAPSGR